MSDSEQAQVRERLVRAVAFVDLAGFTAMTEAHGDEYAADVHDAFVGALAAACAASSGEVECVKHLGDGALLVGCGVRALVAALAGGVRGQSEQELQLRVRAGVHHGPVLRVMTVHGQDYLGHTVNVAARLCGVAAAGELILSGAAIAADKAAADEAGVDAPKTDVVPTVEPRPLGPLSLRHVREQVDGWALPLGQHGDGEGGLAVDPVCQMVVGLDALSVVVGGRTWRFCSPECEGVFLAVGAGSPRGTQRLP